MLITMPIFKQCLSTASGKSIVVYSTMKKVLFVTDTKISFSEAPPSRLLYIARVLKEKAFEVEVVGRKGERVEGLKVTQLGGRKQLARLGIVIYTYLNVFTCSYNSIVVRGGALAFCLLPLRIFGKKIALDFHGWLFGQIHKFYEKRLYNKLKTIFYYLSEKTAARYVNAIVCNSIEANNLLSRNEKSKSLILEDGVDIEEARRLIFEAEQEKVETYKKYTISKDKPIIGFLGNWERWMDMETMFEGANLAKVNLIVIGDGPNLEKFRRKWKRVLFTGRLPRREALKVIHLCDVVIAPYEATYTLPSRKVRDYLAMGKPIIIAHVERTEAFLVPEKNMLLYTPRDAKDLAEKIQILLSNKRLRKIMKENNIALSHQFDWKTLVEESGFLRVIS